MSHTNRKTGRTTNCILQGVRNALVNAGQRVEIRDHFNREAAHRQVTSKVSEILTVLGVAHTVEPFSNFIIVEPMK